MSARHSFARDHESVDLLLTNVRLATMEPGGAPYGVQPFDAVAFRGPRIAWMGREAEAPKAAARIDAGGRWATPALVDCHTHLVYGGNRAHEFELRLAGKSYEEIARAGGGIASTVVATRNASEDELVSQSLPRLRRLAEDGVTLAEVKSGYGLDLEGELKMLRAARRLAKQVPVTIRSTLLALHALPKEYAGRADEYVDFVCRVVVPAAAAAGLADAVDAFCERIAFSPAHVERLFLAAREHHLPVKLHAEQLSNQHGARLAASFRALSADHLEYLDEEGAVAMADAGTVAVLLPGAFVFLGEKRSPPIALLRKHGVPMAVATDHNPGTSPYSSLLLMVNLACAVFRLTPEEALAGVTCHAAHALGLLDRGVIEMGKRADLVIWDADDPAHLSWQIAGLKPRQAIFAGAPRR